jgi:uncharacterized membrane protein YqaE (UPF0057 family)
MLYVLAIIFPPLALLFIGRPGHALLNIPLCFLAWIPGIVHAFVVLNNHYAEQRDQRMLKNIAAMQQPPR